MKLITGFFMAWGNFLTLPCPCKKWENELKNMMLVFLPAIGIVIGGLWKLVFWISGLTDLPKPILCFILIVYIFGICGFMHIDGFMDCSDAIMSRKPTEEKQKILKDSNVGAFAVVMLAFLLMGWYAAMNSAFDHMLTGGLLIIPVMSRSAAALAVLTVRPIGHSQYAGDYREKRRGKYRFAVVICAVITVAATAILAEEARDILICAGAVAVTASAACAYAVKQLGGMSGDVAGYTICIGELAGIMVIAVI